MKNIIQNFIPWFSENGSEINCIYELHLTPYSNDIIFDYLTVKIKETELLYYRVIKHKKFFSYDLDIGFKRNEITRNALLTLNKKND